MINFANNKTRNKLSDAKSWKVLIVDDESEVHSITKSVLKKFELDGKKLVFYSAYTGKDALQILKDYDDIALVFLDVVMESDDSGLKVAKAIREELKNNVVRIILRTGQPGQAPEKDIIRDYDINDYKEKTELTSTKLYTTTISALRSYRDLLKIEASLDHIRQRAFQTAILKNKLQEEITKLEKSKEQAIKHKTEEIEVLEKKLKRIKDRLVAILQNHHDELNSDAIERIRKQFPDFIAIEDIYPVTDPIIKDAECPK